MNKHLMSAVIQYAAFLELSGDEVVDPDAAVSELESLGAVLANLDESEKNTLCNFIEEYASREEKEGAPSERVEFIRSIPDGLGLSGDLD